MKKSDQIVLTGLKISCIIGIFDWERKQKQDVLIDLKIPCDARKASKSDHIRDAVDYKKIAKTTIAFVERSQFKLVETLAEKLAELLIKTSNLSEIELSVSKPAAIRGSQNVGITIYRTANDFKGGHVFLSLGSNIEPRKNLEFALREIAVHYSLVGLSHAYVTSPVGYAKQSAFWNMVAAIHTDEKPEKVRTWLADLEKRSGRIKNGKSFGPRNLDVDLIIWKDLVKKTKGFQLPHPDIATKAFVLFPLLEVAPQWIQPGFQKPLMELAASFKDKTQKIKQLSFDTFPEFPPQPLKK